MSFLSAHFHFARTSESHFSYLNTWSANVNGFDAHVCDDSAFSGSGSGSTSTCFGSGSGSGSTSTCFGSRSSSSPSPSSTCFVSAFTSTCFGSDSTYSTSTYSTSTCFDSSCIILCFGSDSACFDLLTDFLIECTMFEVNCLMCLNIIK